MLVSTFNNTNTLFNKGAKTLMNAIPEIMTVTILRGQSVLTRMAHFPVSAKMDLREMVKTANK